MIFTTNVLLVNCEIKMKHLITITLQIEIKRLGLILVLRFRMATPAKTPNKRNRICENLKIEFFTLIRENWRYLHGAYDSKHTKDERVLKLKAIFKEVSKTDEGKNYFIDENTMWQKFQLFRSDFKTFEKRERHTGVGPNKDWTESRQIMWHIEHEHDEAIAKLKVNNI